MSERYTNIGGPHKRADGSMVTRGDTFTPTPHELDRFGDKFERVTESAPVGGANIGLRSLNWGSPNALSKALDEDVTVEEMQQVEPTGVDGYVTPDVDAVLSLRDEAGED